MPYSPSTIPGVRGATSEYGIEFLIMLAHHVYWLGLSIDKVRWIVEFYTKIGIPKSQADKMLYQLANDWQSEYEEIAMRIAIASILYVDETAWKIGEKACYTWVFGTFADILPLPIEISRMRVRLPYGKTDFHRALCRIFQPA